MPLECVREAFNVAERNEALKKDVGTLEKELEEINEEIGESKNPRVYGPVLREFSEEIVDVARKNQRNDLGLVGGVVTGVGGIISCSTYLISKMRNQF